MKKILLAACFLLGLFSPMLYAQGKTNIQIIGKDKGTVSSIRAAGHTLLDAQAVTKKLGGSVELFSASKQLKIAFPGMYAIVSASLREVIINTVTVPLPTEVIASGGKIYVPVEFFLLPQVQKALDRQLVFENNTLIVERNYTVAFQEREQGPSYDKLRIWTKDNVRFSSQEINKHTVKVTFANAVVKREINERPKDNFIRAFTLAQKGKDVVLEVILGSKGKVWQVAQAGKDVLFSASEKALAAVKPVIDPQKELAPTILAETENTLPAPTVQTEPINAQDEAEELDLTVSAAEENTPTMSAAPLPVMTAVAAPVMTQSHKIRIVIDPGHGGKDPGATRRGSAKEKDLNLVVSKHLYNYLKKQKVEVSLTRKDDTFVTLAGRSKIANELKADLFVSIHTNATKRSDVNGFEVYFRSDKATDKEAADIAAFENESLQYEETHYNFVDKLLQSLAKNEYMNESSKLAGHVRNYVYKEPGIGIAVRQNNSIKQANFYVLRGVQAPAILVEMGFISSPKDRARLNNKSAQKKMGEGIGKGIISYLKAEGKVK